MTHIPFKLWQILVWTCRLLSCRSVQTHFWTSYICPRRVQYLDVKPRPSFQNFWCFWTSIYIHVRLTTRHVLPACGCLEEAQKCLYKTNFCVSEWKAHLLRPRLSACRHSEQDQNFKTSGQDQFWAKITFYNKTDVPVVWTEQGVKMPDSKSFQEKSLSKETSTLSRQSHSIHTVKPA